MKVFNIEETKIILGENASENWKILDNSDPTHYFFHLSSFPSGYVILQESNPTVDMINTCAMYCKSGTKYKNIKNLKVDYCPCYNLQKGEKTGEVLYKRRKLVMQIKI